MILSVRGPSTETLVHAGLPLMGSILLGLLAKALCQSLDCVTPLMGSINYEASNEPQL